MVQALVLLNFPTPHPKKEEKKGFEPADDGVKNSIVGEGEG